MFFMLCTYSSRLCEESARLQLVARERYCFLTLLGVHFTLLRTCVYRNQEGIDLALNVIDDSVPSVQAVPSGKSRK